MIQNYTCKNPITMIGFEAGICWGADTEDEKKNYRRGLDCLESGHGIDEGGADNFLTGNDISGGGVTSYNNNNCNFEKYDGPALEDDCYTDARILNLG